MLTMNKKIYLNGVLSINPADPTNNPSILVTADKQSSTITNCYAGIMEIATNILEYGYDAYLRVFSPLSNTVYDIPLTYIGCTGDENDPIQVNALNDSIEIDYTHVRFIISIDIHIDTLIFAGLFKLDANGSQETGTVLIPLTVTELATKTQ